MKCDPVDSDRTNLFALVSYIPGALGEFLDRLREELVAGCNPNAHVTVLPPRPLDTDIEADKRIIRRDLEVFVPFQVDIDRIQIFDQTNVVYGAIGRGRKELEQMHDALNRDGLWFQEPYEYHPHVTLAQGLDPEVVPAVFELAQRRWQESAPARSFVVDELAFVQNTGSTNWIDLAEFELTPVRVRR